MAEVASSTLVARLQLPRAAWLLNLFGLLGVAGYVARGWRTGSLPRPLALLLLAPLLVAPPDFLPLDPLLVVAVPLLVAQALWPAGSGRVSSGGHPGCWRQRVGWPGSTRWS